MRQVVLGLHNIHPDWSPAQLGMAIRDRYNRNDITHDMIEHILRTRQTRVPGLPDLPAKRGLPDRGRRKGMGR